MRAVVAAALVFAAAGCTAGGVDRDDYLNGNTRLLDTLPAYPHARAFGDRSTPGRDEEDGPVSHYVTTRDLLLPAEATPAAVARFYVHALCPTWTLVEQLDGPVLDFRRGDALVSVNLENWQTQQLELAVDHEAYSEPEERPSLCPTKKRPTT